MNLIERVTLEEDESFRQLLSFLTCVFILNLLISPLPVVFNIAIIIVFITS